MTSHKVTAHTHGVHSNAISSPGALSYLNFAVLGRNSGHKRKHTCSKSLSQNVSDSFCRYCKIVLGPFMEHAESAADGTGNHIREFFFAVAGRSCILGDFCHITVEHGQRFF